MKVSWPVGQAVKTAASHAVNVGSSPARVTIESKVHAALTVIYLVGTDYGEGTPVPIPNTEVKLTCAEDTWLVTARDNRWRQHKYSSLAQPVEHAAVNRRVVGSSPTRGARECRPFNYGRFLYV